MFDTFNINRLRVSTLFLYISLLIISNLYCQKDKPYEGKERINAFLFYQKIQTDSLFESTQIINLIYLPKNRLHQYDFDLAHHSYELIATSQFAKNENAVAAVNGGFFNMDKGGSVTYLEENDSVYQKNIPHGPKWSIADWAKTGAVIIKKDGQLKLEHATDQAYYEKSKAEESVLITGPILLENGLKSRIWDAKFVKNRHPRTCLCETKTDYILVTIDGRQSKAQGMSLPELQDFLLEQNCINAVNLDGGGSTTMWIKDKGIVNNPCDLFGERKVANAILIKRKK